MKYIAIFKVKNNDCYECNYESILHTVVDWTEVTNEEFSLLQKASEHSRYYNNDVEPFIILERPKDTKNFIANTLQAYKAYAEEVERKAQEAKRKKAEAAEKRRITLMLKKKKDAKSKIALLKKELAELESMETTNA